MKREEAFALVRQHGGTPRRGVTKKTGVLVVGELGWPLLPDGKPSKSLSLAKSYGVAIASERRFLEWAGRARPGRPGQDLLRRSDRLAERPAARGDRAARRVRAARLRASERYGFRDLTAARQLAELLASGVALSTITRSLHEIRKWLPDAALSNLRLYPASSDAILVEHMKGRTDKTGQFVLAGRRGAEKTPTSCSSRRRRPRRRATSRPRSGSIAGSCGSIPAIRPPPSISATCCEPSAARSRPRRPIGRPPRPTRASPRPGTISPTCSTTRAAPTRRSPASSARSTPIPDYADAIFNLGLLHQRNERHAGGGDLLAALSRARQRSRPGRRAPGGR